ncbi:ATP synthase F1 subunit gamma [Candidatus Saccharibacteria bacterium]|nr:ATP synthase F1 subunit gamma [Candidatus Saccharibacteria bacterium]MBH1972794.1 ATP synthase F1 subunit gamma [Candidatus Saccharibacteria bacterium]MBH1990995.1 ATP synthase F1 subunit gamma [Candidatus Saccharibacteria bacterium]
MASTQQLKSRIRSVKSTKQITKAMQLVAASKMRRAQEADKASAPYTKAANELLTYLASQGVTKNHPLFTSHVSIDSRLLIVIASDKGLAGAYNSNVMKLYTRELKSDDDEGIKNMTISVGRRATQFVTRLKDAEIIGAYEDLPDHPAGAELRSILDTARDKFEAGEVDAVDIIYTEFVNSMTQTAKIQRVMPAGYEVTSVSDSVRDAEFEPNLETVLEGVAYRLVGAQIFQALLDARASEWSMRMLAMKNATDNASDLVDDLTLEMNKARQGAITQELAEISGGVEALND